MSSELLVEMREHKDSLLHLQTPGLWITLETLPGCHQVEPAAQPIRLIS